MGEAPTRILIFFFLIFSFSVFFYVVFMFPIASP